MTHADRDAARSVLDYAIVRGDQWRDAAFAAEAKVARVEAVRRRVLDPTAQVTEGPLIARIKVESWLRAALDGPDATEAERTQP